MKETSVDWLFQQLWETPKDKLTWNTILSKAKEMEKEQMMDAFVECWKANVPEGVECKLDAEQYYNETYGK